MKNTMKTLIKISLRVLGAVVAAAIAVASTVEALTSANRVNKVRIVLFDGGILRAYTRSAENFLRSNPASPFRIEKADS